MRKTKTYALIALFNCAGALAGAQPARADEPRTIKTASAQTVMLPAVIVGGIRNGDTLLVTGRAIELVKLDQLEQKLMPKTSVPLDNCLVR